MNINCMMQMTPSLSPSRYNGKNLPKTVNEIKETLDIEATRAVESGLITDRQSMKKNGYWILVLKSPEKPRKAYPLKNRMMTKKPAR